MGLAYLRLTFKSHDSFKSRLIDAFLNDRSIGLKLLDMKQTGKISWTRWNVQD